MFSHMKDKNSYLTSILSPFWLYLRAIADSFLTHRSFTWSPGPILIFWFPTAASQPSMWLLCITQISQHWRAPGFKPSHLFFSISAQTLGGLWDRWYWYPTFQNYVGSLDLCLKCQPNVYNYLSGVSTPMSSQPQSSSSPPTAAPAAAPTLQLSNHLPSHPWTPFFFSDSYPMYLLKCSAGKSMLSDNIYPKRRKGNRKEF